MASERDTASERGHGLRGGHSLREGAWPQREDTDLERRLELGGLQLP